MSWDSLILQEKSINDKHKEDILQLRTSFAEKITEDTNLDICVSKRCVILAEYFADDVSYMDISCSRILKDMTEELLKNISPIKYVENAYVIDREKDYDYWFDQILESSQLEEDIDKCWDGVYEFASGSSCIEKAQVEKICKWMRNFHRDTHSFSSFVDADSIEYCAVAINALSLKPTGIFKKVNF